MSKCAQFTPKTAAQAAAYAAWEALEPSKPESLPFYLWAAKKGLPPDKFYQFLGEIKQDRNIRNPGAVFYAKVRKFLSEKGGP